MSKQKTCMSMHCVICNKRLYSTTHKRCEMQTELWYLVLKRLNEKRSKNET